MNLVQAALMKEPGVTSRAIRPLAAGFDALGLRTEEGLTACGIERSILDDGDERITHSAAMRLWQWALAASGDVNLGLHAALAAPLASFELHAYALLASRDLRDGLRRACRYQRLIHESTLLRFDESPGHGELSHTLGDGRSAPRQAAEFLAALWFRFGRSIAGPRWHAQWLRFDHAAPADTAEHEAYFGCPLRFGGGCTAVRLANDALDAPNQGAEPAMAEMLDRYAALLLDRAPRADTLASRLRAWVAQGLSSDAISVLSAARALGVSPRTLHRRLRDEGTSFRSLVEATRQAQALRLLADSQLSIAEVGFVTGFSEISAFHRAFKRWTGQTPAQYRRSRLARADDDR
jgi:AraC-like DNA-binding protein